MDIEKRALIFGTLWGLVSLLLNTGIGSMGRYQPGLFENIIFLPVGILNILRPQLPAPILMLSAILMGVVIVYGFSKIYLNLKSK